MPRNIEIKAEAKDLSLIRAKAEAIAGTTGETIYQEDIFFHSEAGKFKLRKLGSDHGELIFYERLEEAGLKDSSYLIAETKDPDLLKIILTKACGVKGEVRKVRELFIAGQTRIHLDQVEGIGDFIELEYVMKDGQAGEEGINALRGLMEKLGIREDDLKVGAYLDLMGNRAAESITQRNNVHSEEKRCIDVRP
jgi:predicted adenylyl cyclase CyaB